MIIVGFSGGREGCSLNSWGARMCMGCLRVLECVSFQACVRVCTSNYDIKVCVWVRVMSEYWHSSSMIRRDKI